MALLCSANQVPLRWLMVMESMNHPCFGRTIFNISMTLDRVLVQIYLIRVIDRLIADPSNLLGLFHPEQIQAPNNFLITRDLIALSSLVSLQSLSYLMTLIKHQRKLHFYESRDT